MTARTAERRNRLSGVAKIIYADGACSPNPGRGGWGWWVSDRECGSGAVESSTNNIMELRAVIEALRAQPLDQFVQIVSDSKYVVDCFEQRWYASWRERGWRKSNGEEVKNRDVWEELLAVVEARTANTKWAYVKGHSGDPGNDRADALAVAARKGIDAETVDDFLASGAAPDAGHAGGSVCIYPTPGQCDGSVHLDCGGGDACVVGHVLDHLGLTVEDVRSGNTAWGALLDKLQPTGCASGEALAS